MIIKKDYPCPFKNGHCHIKNSEDNLVVLYNDGRVVFWGMWEYADLCTQMAEGHWADVLASLDLSLPRDGYLGHKISGMNKRRITVEDDVYEDLKNLQETALKETVASRRITNSIGQLEVLEEA